MSGSAFITEVIASDLMQKQLAAQQSFLPLMPNKVEHCVTVCYFSVQVRPFTLGQLKELLGRTGSVQEEGFWIDKIKSHCYVTVSHTPGLSFNVKNRAVSYLALYCV